MSIDNCFTEDVKKAADILESTYQSAKKHLRNKGTVKPYEDARNFVDQYKLCVNMGRSTEVFCALLPKYLQGFSNSSVCSEYGAHAAFLIVTGGLSVYSYSNPQTPLFALSSIAFGLGCISLLHKLDSSLETRRVRNALSKDAVLLDDAFEKIKGDRAAEARLYKG